MTSAATLPVIFHEDYEFDIGAHVFPTQKFRLVRDRLLADGTIAEADIIRPETATDAQVTLAHTAEYVGKINEDNLSYQEQVILEVPFSPGLRDSMWLCAGGSILTGRLALEKGLATHICGGFHHAFANHGEGFCLINDVAIAIRVLMNEGLVERAMVVDCDLHHGNGTAAIFAGDPSVFTFSMHQQHNYPPFKPPSDLDLGLEDGTGDDEYLALLTTHLPKIVSAHQPELAFYLAGADPYREDQLGGLKLSIAGLRERDEKVINILRDAGVPVATTTAGGYALSQNDTVEIHSNTIRVAKARIQKGCDPSLE
jgi:acetoin utilization deacetylase AcuC-like enzyme